MKFFVHGTLMESSVRIKVIGKLVKAKPATLRNWNRNGCLNIGRKEDSYVDGCIFNIETLEDIQKLDNYESCPLWYSRERITTTDGDRAYVYFIPIDKTITTLPSYGCDICYNTIIAYSDGWSSLCKECADRYNYSLNSREF